MVLGEGHLRRILARYFSYYHRARTQSLARGVYEWFNEGFAMAGLRDARALLEEVS